MNSDGCHFVIFTIVYAVLLLLGMYCSCCEKACEQSDCDKKGRREDMLCRLLNERGRLSRSFFFCKTVLSVLMAADITACIFLTDNSFLWKAAVCFCSVILSSMISAAVCEGVPIRIMTGEEKCTGFAVKNVYAVKVITAMAFPLVIICEAVSGSNGDEKVTEEEILSMVDSGNETGAIEESEREMINNVFEFHDMTVSDVMTHRTDVTAVSITSDIGDVIRTAIESGFSRIPVYDGNIDRIKGVIYVKDLLGLVSTHTSESASVTDFLRGAEFVPQSCMCDVLFRKFTEGRIQFAVAVDEYGGTAGIVTMEDLVESVFGNIRDEYDNEAEDITRISENSWIISGTADAGDVMEKLGGTLPDDSEYDTIGGFITDMLGYIPADSETPTVEYMDISFTVLYSEDMRIERIKAVKDNNKKEEKESGDNEEKNR